MKKLLIALLALFVLGTMFGGCAKKDDFAVKVNEQSIARAIFEQKLEAAKNYYAKQGIDLQGAQSEAILTAIKSEVLAQLIRTEIINQEVAKNQWDSNDPEVIKNIEELKKELADQDYDAWLNEQAISHQDIVNYYTAYTHVVKDVTVTDQEVLQFFDANFALYGGQEEQVNAKHILVNTEAEAQDVINQLKAGADFAALAKEKSIDPGSKDAGGELGYFAKGDMVPEFEEAAFSQAKGQIPDKAVKSDYGYHVIVVEDHKPEIKPDFEKVKDNVKNDALQYAKYQKFQTYFSEVAEKAKIEYAEDLKPAGAE